jgi:hypothetical protein
MPRVFPEPFVIAGAEASPKEAVTRVAEPTSEPSLVAAPFHGHDPRLLPWLLHRAAYEHRSPPVSYGGDSLRSMRPFWVSTNAVSPMPSALAAVPEAAALEEDASYIHAQSVHGAAASSLSILQERAAQSNSEQPAAIVPQLAAPVSIDGLMPPDIRNQQQVDTVAHALNIGPQQERMVEAPLLVRVSAE